MASVSFRNVNKRFATNFAVRDLNLEIMDGEYVVLVGPSGCGKTTTLRMIAGLEQPTEGEIFIGEKCVNNVEPKDRDIAMVFQNYALYPHMNVYENMAFGLKLRKIPKAEIKRRVNEAASILGIENLLGRKPRELSGGQRQRVALGRAIVRHPKVFLMDEPLSNLDAKLRVQMRTELLKLHERLKTTFIYVTHDQTEAMTLAHRIVVMNDGLVQQVGTPKEVYNHPNNMFVAGFIGSPPMNFLKGYLVIDENRLFWVLGNNRLIIPLEKAISLKNYIGDEVYLGIRPEKLRVQKGFKDYSCIEANLEVSELTGSESYLHLKVEGQNLVVRVPAEENQSPGQLVILVDMNSAHFFNPTTTEAIL
ncbi:sn-glycerol-3-phosphate ABC transporter ATP-binding protein UgpC [Moorella naiadis]|uniref:ABC transporter ATP-binding protein n=1 Tax=Moorella naiadis (nom. illeg.) TaxID=3093670 RepID=UPI003D9CA776